jgi:hypothetical protein
MLCLNDRRQLGGCVLYLRSEVQTCLPHPRCSLLVACCHSWCILLGCNVCENIYRTFYNPVLRVMSRNCVSCKVPSRRHSSSAISCRLRSSVVVSSTGHTRWAKYVWKFGQPLSFWRLDELLVGLFQGSMSWQWPSRWSWPDRTWSLWYDIACSVVFQQLCHCIGVLECQKSQFRLTSLVCGWCALICCSQNWIDLSAGYRLGPSWNRCY